MCPQAVEDFRNSRIQLKIDMIERDAHSKSLEIMEKFQRRGGMLDDDGHRSHDRESSLAMECNEDMRHQNVPERITAATAMTTSEQHLRSNSQLNGTIL